MRIQVARRSDRVSVRVPIEVIGRDIKGQPFVQLTRTLVISRYGACVPLAQRLATKQELVIRRVGREHVRAAASRERRLPHYTDSSRWTRPHDTCAGGGLGTRAVPVRWAMRTGPLTCPGNRRMSWDRPCPAKNGQPAPVAVGCIDKARCRVLVDFPLLATHRARRLVWR